ncbi:MAG: DUF3458 domain-containing protein, partial [Thiohalobacteraceae bacterium]
RGTDLYFQRHDGQAVTTEDFVRAIEEANGVRLQQFRHWYSQAGTPRIRVERRYDPAARTYALMLEQDCPATPGQAQKEPFHIPVAVALLGADGQPLPLRLYGESENAAKERVLQFCEAQESFVFQDVPAEPVPSVLRGFSAPVRLELEYSDAELAFLLANDNDPFNRWEAGQRLARRLILQLVAAWQAGSELEAPTDFVEALAAVLGATGLEPAFQALVLTLPNETYLAEFMPVVDPDALHAARQYLRRHLAERLRANWLAHYRALRQTGAYRPDAEAVGRRCLRNLCLSYLMELEGDQEVLELCLDQSRKGDNMTDVLAALTALAQRSDARADEALDAFYARWQGDPLVVDKWLAVQATSRRPDTLERVQALTQHPAFTLKNPNKVYALLRSFSQANPVRFHQPDGAGYRFVGEQIARLDRLNPQVAARLAGAFNDWRRYDEDRRSEMRRALERLQNLSALSRDVREIVSKALE